MKAMVFAAGLGTRLKPVTDNIPKALVPIGDGTLLSVVIDKLKKSGFDGIVVNAHHFAPKIVSYLKENDNFGADISLSVEEEMPLETGGGLKKAARLLKGQGRVLVHNVDIVSNLDLGRFVSSVPSDALASLVVSDRKTSRYLLFDEEMKLVGWTNLTTGEVKSSIRDLDPSQYRRLAFDGIHCISDKVFDMMEEYPEKFSIIDFYLDKCCKYPIYGYVQEGLKVVDVGKIESLEEARRFYSTM